jgi:hypothetical protein
MSNLRHYQGIDFEVWDGQQTWFWFVTDPCCDGGAIGAAASETEAVRDACLSIDAMMSARCEPICALDWEVTLASLERYLAQCCGSAAQ